MWRSVRPTEYEVLRGWGLTAYGSGDFTPGALQVTHTPVDTSTPVLANGIINPVTVERGKAIFGRPWRLGVYALCLAEQDNLDPDVRGGDSGFACRARARGERGHVAASLMQRL